MVLLWFATENSKKNVSIADETYLLNELDQIETMIDAESK